MADLDTDMGTYAATILGLRITWALTIVLVLFVSLRIAVRLLVVRKFGPDDHAFLWAGMIGLVSSIVFQVSCNWGFDSPAWSYDIPNFSQIMIGVVAAQTLVLVALTLAKVSVGLFILNLVLERWQRIFMWVLMATLVGLGITAVGVSWLACTPVQALWDTEYFYTRTCIDAFPVAILHGVFGAFYDFSFAIMPWILIWPHSKIPRKEKLHSCVCLSLGGLGGFCAIGKLYTQVRAQSITVSRYESTLAYLVWPVGELLTIIVCVATPAAIRPLFLRFRRRNGDKQKGQAKDNNTRTPNYDTSWLHLDDLPEIDSNLEPKAYPV